MAIVVIAFSLVFNFLIAPVLKDASLLHKEISFTKLKLNKYRYLLSQKERLQKKYGKFAAGLNLSQSGKDTVVTALAELENLAKDANIRIVDLRPQSSKTLDLYKEALIDLRTEGNMEGYLKFIYNIEHSLTLLRIKRFQLVAKPNSQLLEGIFSISQLFLSE